MEWILLVAGILAGAVAGYLFAMLKAKNEILEKEKETEAQNNRFNAEKNSLITEKEVLAERLKSSEEEKARLNQQISEERERREQAENNNTALRSEMKHLEEKLENQKKELEQLQERFKTEFENIANKILKQNTKEFSESSHKNMSELLNPLKEKIETFEKKVEDTYQKGLKDQTDLRAELKKLHELNTKLGEEAGNLTRALKADSKQQVDCGEVVLERILERSVLIKNEEYFTQQTENNEEGKLLRPDVMIKLPEEKYLIIDSKVSLTAYEAYISAENEKQKETALKRHLDSVKKHIKELRDKKYDNLKGVNTPDFVLMFMPVEPAFALAVQEDPELFNYAWEQRIVIVSPTTLLATLRTVASIWRHEKQTKHAMEIAQQGGRLYDKFVGFLTDLEKIGANIERARVSFDEAKKKLKTGRGNIINQLEKMKEMGAKATKSISEKYLEE